MRSTRIVWSLAALIVVLLGVGLGGYAHLGAGSSQPSPAAAARAVAPIGPQPTVATPPDIPHHPPTPGPRARPASPTRTATPGPGAPRPAKELRYTVQPHDTLWDLAAAHLGSPTHWVQLFDLNRGRTEPNGTLIDPDRIYVGWTLEFPAGATGLPRETAMTTTTPVTGPDHGPAATVTTRLVDRAGAADGGGWAL